MAFGMTLGATRASMGFGSRQSRGTSLRPGRAYQSIVSQHAPSAAGVAAPPDTGDLQQGIAGAMRGAEQVRAASTAPVRQDNPYITPTDVPEKLYGGTMGLTPDFTARDEAQKEAERLEANPPGWFERAAFGDESYYDRVRAARNKAAWAEKKAIEDAMKARAADPRYQQWEEVPGAITPTGQRVQRDPYGNVRPAEVEEKIRNEGPLSAEFDPYSGKEFATVREPVMDREYQQAMRPQLHYGTDAEGRPFIVKGEEAMPARGAENFPKRSDVEKGLIGQRVAGQVEVKTTPGAPSAGTSGRGEMTAKDWVAREATERDRAKRAAQAEADAAFQKNFDYWPQEKVEKRADELFNRSMAALRETAGGAKPGGGGGLPPAAAEKVKKLAPGKKLKFANGQTWINDNGTPRQVG